MPLHDTSYQHWQGTHVGLWGRRWAIARNGLGRCLHAKPTGHLVVLCWIMALAMALFMFLVGQLLVADSVVVQWAGNLNPQLQEFTRLLTAWLEQHPQISVHALQNLLFHYFSLWLLPISIAVLGLAVPMLVTRDLASNAITIYASKAVSRGDYLLGKFSTAFGLLTLTWLGPLCAAWLLGNLLGPDWRFFWHARVALWHTVLFCLAGMVTLSLLALGVSACSSKEKSTPAIWFVWWMVGGVLGPIATHTRPWLRHLSFHFNLDQLAVAIFRPANDIVVARDEIPVLGELLRNVRPEDMAALNSPAVWGALVALGLMVVASACLLAKRVKPE